MPSSTKPGFIPELEATRGLAALIVAGFHAAQTPVVPGANRFETQLVQQMRISSAPIESALGHFAGTFLNGPAAVLYFFVLSGFVLAASLQRDGRPAVELSWRFILRRLFRIYPAVMAVVLFFTVIGHLTGRGINGPAPLALETVLANMFLLSTNIDGVMWTMAIELLAMPFILIAFLLWSRVHILGLVGVAVLLTSLTYSSDWKNLFDGAWPAMSPLFYPFIFGMFAYAMGRRVIAMVPPRLHGVLALLAIVVLLVAPPALKGIKHILLVQTFAATYLVGFVAFGQMPRTSRFLRYLPVRFVGRVSYSFYLLHPATLVLVWNLPEFWARLIDAGLPRGVLLVGLIPGTILAVLPLAWLSYRFVELPGIALGQRIVAKLSGDRRAVPTPPPETAALASTDRGAT